MSRSHQIDLGQQWLLFNGLFTTSRTSLTAGSFGLTPAHKESVGMFVKNNIAFGLWYFHQIEI